MAKLRETITELLKEALGDHKVDKGKQKSSNHEDRLSCLLINLVAETTRHLVKTR